MRTKDVLQNLSMPRAEVLFSGPTYSSWQEFLLQEEGERRYQKTYTRDKMSNRRCDRLVRQPSITESIDSEGSDDVESGRGNHSIHTSDEEFIEPDTGTDSEGEYQYNSDDERSQSSGANDENESTSL
jgi:hypothetical protein